MYDERLTSTSPADKYRPLGGLDPKTQNSKGNIELHNVGANTEEYFSSRQIPWTNIEPQEAWYEYSVWSLPSPLLQFTLYYLCLLSYTPPFLLSLSFLSISSSFSPSFFPFLLIHPICPIFLSRISSFAQNGMNGQTQGKKDAYVSPGCSKRCICHIFVFLYLARVEQSSVEGVL